MLKGCFPDHLQSLLHGKQTFLGIIIEHSNDQLVKNFCGTLDHIEMAAGVKNGGIYHLTDLADAMMKDHDVADETLVDMVYKCDGAVFPTDMFGSEKYKRYLLGTLAAGLLADAKKGGLA